jgi:hypothetical protein
MKYMAAIDLWLEQLLEPRLDGTDEDLWLRIKKEFKSKLVESYRAGKAAK